MDEGKTVLQQIWSNITEGSSDESGITVSGIAVSITPLLYLVIIVVLTVFIFDGSIYPSFYVYLVLMGLSLAANMFLIRYAIMNDKLQKLITYLAFAHLPAIIGLTYFIFDMFILR